MMKMAGCDVCVCEVSSQSLSQQRVYGINFDISVFTNLSREHLDYHKNMESYIEAKAELMKISTVSVINADDGYAEYMKKNAKGKRLLTRSIQTLT